MELRNLIRAMAWIVLGIVCLLFLFLLRKGLYERVERQAADRRVSQVSTPSYVQPPPPTPEPTIEVTWRDIPEPAPTPEIRYVYLPAPTPEPTPQPTPQPTPYVPTAFFIDTSKTPYKDGPADVVLIPQGHRLNQGRRPCEREYRYMAGALILKEQILETTPEHLIPCKRESKEGKVLFIPLVRDFDSSNPKP